MSTSVAIVGRRAHSANSPHDPVVWLKTTPTQATPKPLSSRLHWARHVSQVISSRSRFRQKRSDALKACSRFVRSVFRRQGIHWLALRMYALRIVGL